MNREQLETQPQKKYIEVQYSAVSQGYLREYCLDNGFDITVSFSGKKIDPDNFDFHSTVWYTTSAHVIENYSEEVNIDDIRPKGFALFGPDKNVLVLEIESDKLNEIRETIGDEYGMQDEYPEFRPHITLSYLYTDSDLPQIELPNADMLEATVLNVKNQKVFK